MATTHFTTVDEYLATFPDGVADVLRTVRRAIQEAVPSAEETISYQMPAYRLHGWLLYFAGFKKHYSLFVPQPESVISTFSKELSGYEVSKSTFKFPLDRPVPVELIRNMAKLRADENSRRDMATQGRTRSNRPARSSRPNSGGRRSTSNW